MANEKKDREPAGPARDRAREVRRVASGELGAKQVVIFGSLARALEVGEDAPARGRWTSPRR
ncbi:MAG: hypothetical protein AVDCRST_MAG80-719 [uncultured Rubrobacteraceae bacterium]|uniref:Uncharacterized protein n=1 Tax=uncultured Rubrobacteraceae bacterium TaxID=349277 RepID=A0A6J4Q4F1_9ACTN|nr:MAG: hypothetical protein AVDCRST_MAG80-719 [uncultured Rubrobacteraceae bacterium]